MYIYLFPFGFQYAFTPLLQLGHFSDTMIQPELVSRMSQTRFLHRLFGHFIFRINHLPKIHLLLSPCIDMEQGNHPVPVDSKLIFCLNNLSSIIFPKIVYYVFD